MVVLIPSKLWRYNWQTKIMLSSVQSLSSVWLSAIPWTTARWASLSITNSARLTQTHVHWVGDATQPSHPLQSLSPSAFNHSQHQGFFPKESVLGIMWPKYCSFSFSISPFNEYSGLISFRMDWFDFLAVQGTLKSLLQYHSSKTSILWCSAFFTVQLSHPYMTTGKTIALTRWTFVGKVSVFLICCLIGHSFYSEEQTSFNFMAAVTICSDFEAQNLSQNQGLFKWVSSSHEVAKVLKFQLQHQSFQWKPRTDLL